MDSTARSPTPSGFPDRAAPDELLAVLEGRDSLAIICHDNPDPDCLASALALEYLADSAGVGETELLYGGEITHQQNRAMVNALDIDLERFEAGSLSAFELRGFVDHAVPGRNNTVPPGTEIDVVIDHHELDPVEAAYVDHRPELGATATILTEYLSALGDEPSERLATALSFAIRRETLGFSRGTTRHEHDAASMLHPHADAALVERLTNTMFTTATLDAIGRAITHRTTRGSWLVANAGRTAERDAIPQAADYLLNLEGVNVTIVFAIVGDAIQLSARARSPAVHVGEWMSRTLSDLGSAGGHPDMAGGRVPVGPFAPGDDPSEAALDLATEALKRRLFDAIEEGT